MRFVKIVRNAKPIEHVWRERDTEKKVGRESPGKQKGATVKFRNPMIFMVGARGFEPPTL